MIYIKKKPIKLHLLFIYCGVSIFSPFSFYHLLKAPLRLCSKHFCVDILDYNEEIEYVYLGSMSWWG